MVTLRIWYPRTIDRLKVGFSSIEIGGPTGAAYMSLRPVKPVGRGSPHARTASLADDVKAEGGDTSHVWLFTRLNEKRMLGLWDQHIGIQLSADAKIASHDCFQFCDKMLAAGRGVVVDALTASSLTERALGARYTQSLATTALDLAARADQYLKLSHW
jgi:hypothetical protein